MMNNQPIPENEGGGVVRTRSVIIDFLPLLVFPAIALMLRPVLASWVFMWAMACGIFAGCKWLTWRRAGRRPASAWRSLGYLLLWPGLDAQQFLGDDSAPIKPRVTEWIVAGLKSSLGIALVWFIARLVPTEYPVAAGWIGMAGMILILHFGTFELLSLGWRVAGVNARPLMETPILAASLSEFWGRRWNSAFNQLAHDLLFRPLWRRVGTSGATLAVFVTSGLVHELVISLPAGGGYGLPTAYFLAQGVGILLERSAMGKRMGLRRGGAGRVFALLITVAPAFWLFHPMFVTRVIVPLMHAIHAL